MVRLSTGFFSLRNSGAMSTSTCSSSGGISGLCSVGGGTYPGKVFRGTAMAGHMGHERVTVKNATVVRTDAERNLLLIKGAVPGAPGGAVMVRPSAKALS